MSKEGESSPWKQIEECTKKGDFYSALQIFKSLYFRAAPKKQTNLVIGILLKGSILMLDNDQTNAGGELGLMLVDYFINNQVEPENTALQAISTIFNHFKPGLHPSKISFANKSILWSSKPSNGDSGDPMLHNLYAKVFFEDGDIQRAQNHFLRGDQPEVFGNILVDILSISEQSNTKDLILARVVLEYLCLKNIKDANIIYDFVLNGYPMESPLITFLNYLLQLIETDGTPLFNTLISKYDYSLNRDPKLLRYLHLIGKIYYNIESKQSGIVGMLSNMMKDIFNE